jgi:hypothetical protein
VDGSWSPYGMLDFLNLLANEWLLVCPSFRILSINFIHDIKLTLKLSLYFFLFWHWITRLMITKLYADSNRMVKKFTFPLSIQVIPDSKRFRASTYSISCVGPSCRLNCVHGLSIHGCVSLKQLLQVFWPTRHLWLWLLHFHKLRGLDRLDWNSGVQGVRQGGGRLRDYLWDCMHIFIFRVI